MRVDWRVVLVNTTTAGGTLKSQRIWEDTMTVTEVREKKESSNHMIHIPAGVVSPVCHNMACEIPRAQTV